MNFDYVLFWMAMISCVALLARTLPLRRPQRRGSVWTTVAVVILAVGGGTYFFLPDYAGRVVGTLWGLFIVLPSLLIRVVLRHALGQRYAQAARCAKLVRLLHPGDGWRDSPTLYHALALSQAGQREPAANLLRGLMERPGVVAQVAQTARVYLYRMDGRWEDLLAWTEGTIDVQGNPIKGDGGGPKEQWQGIKPGTPVHDPGVLLLRVRALGETGKLSDLLVTFQASRGWLERLPHPSFWPTCQLSFFAFTGREETVARLLEGPLAGMTPEAKTFWRATARMAAGKADAARADLRELASRTHDQDLRRAVERRLSHDLADAQAVLSSAERATLDVIEADVQRDQAYHPPAAAAGLRRAAVTLTLIGLNLGMFFLEVVQGGSENVEVLYRLGALWPPAVIQGGEWYRVVTALFLHLGPVHLALNLLGLAVIGPWVERTLGRPRYTLVYFVGGVGSMVAVLGLVRGGWMHEEVLVGASGAIMGLIGATGALLVVGWRRERSRLAARRLRVVVLIVVLQTGFDFLVPQISFAAHAAGLLVGFLLTVSLAARKDSPTQSLHNRKR